MSAPGAYTSRNRESFANFIIYASNVTKYYFLNTESVLLYAKQERGLLSVVKWHIMSAYGAATV